MINYLALFIVLGFWAAVLVMIYEKVRFMTGKKMLIDKLIAFLEKVYQRTEPQNQIEKDVRSYQLTEKVIVKRVYFDD